MLANESFGAPKEHTTNNFIEGKEIFSKVQNSHDIWQKFKHYARYSLQCQGNDIRKEYQKFSSQNFPSFFNPHCKNLVFSQDDQSRSLAATPTLLLKFRKRNEKLKLPTASD